MDVTGRRSRRGTGEVLVVLALTAVLLALSGWVFLHYWFENAGIAPGVYLLGHDLGYLRQDKALERVEQIVQSTYDDPVYLRHKDRLWILRFGEHFRLKYDPGALVLEALALGRRRTVSEQLSHHLYLTYPRVDLPWRVTVDREGSAPLLTAALKKFSRSKIFARPAPDQPGSVELTILSGEMAVQKVLDALERSFQTSAVVEYRVVELTKLEEGGSVAVVRMDDPDQGFTKVLSEVQTRFDPLDAPRAANLQVVFTRVHQYLINPGDIFSFNAVVGDRTLALGFQETPLLQGGQVKTSLEHGACQVASALYQAALLTGARVVERHISENYTPALDYAQPGLEALVATGRQDLKFQNTLDFPIMLEAASSGGTATLRLVGIQKLPYKVEVRPGRLQKISYETQIKKDPSLRRGLEVVEETGIDGYEAKVFRTFSTLEGVKYREEILYGKADYYLAKPSIVRVGLGDPRAATPEVPVPVPVRPSSGSEGATTGPGGADEPDFLAPE